MIAYFLNSILCLAILLLVYHLFLEKEKMHRFNRWYLLGSIVFACIVPLIRFTATAEALAIPILQDTYFSIIEPVNNIPAQQAAASDESTNFRLPILPVIYALITVLLLIRFIANIYRLLSRAAKNRTITYKGARLVLLKEKIASHSFLNNIFISEEDYADHSIEEELITHELTHVREKHSWDVIFVELMQTIFWFNPLFFFYKKAIQLNHEYLADDAVIKTYDNVPAYQYLLLDKASCNNNTYLTSNFNYSVTKKRLVMMTRTSNKTTALLKQLSVLPLLAFTLAIFSSKEISAKQTTPPEKATSPQQKKTVQKAELVHPFTGNTPFTKEGVSQASFDEYVATQNKYKYFLEKDGRESVHFQKITDEDRNKLESIFKKMSREQQSKVQLIFFPPMKPIKANPPTDAQLNKWKDGNLYGVWIGDKKINNEELNNYQASDFAYYNASKLYPNARKNVKYLVQVNIMTHAQFNDMNDRIKKEKRFGMAYSHARAAEKSK